MNVNIFLGLGSNIGDRTGSLNAAIEAVKNSPHFNNVRVSRLYESSPVGPKQKYFVNAALSAQTDLSAAGLLRFSKETEKKLGRKQRKLRWGPREIDIDILFYGRRVLKKKGLQIPHPEIANRLFVLAPLCDIAPDFIHPLFKKTVNRLRKDALLTYPEQKVRIYKTSKKESGKN